MLSLDRNIAELDAANGCQWAALGPALSEDRNLNEDREPFELDGDRGVLCGVAAVIGARRGAQDGSEAMNSQNASVCSAERPHPARIATAT